MTGRERTRESESWDVFVEAYKNSIVVVERFSKIQGQFRTAIKWWLRLLARGKRREKKEEEDWVLDAFDTHNYASSIIHKKNPTFKLKVGERELKWKT